MNKLVFNILLGLTVTAVVLWVLLGREPGTDTKEQMSSAGAVSSGARATEAPTGGNIESQPVIGDSEGIVDQQARPATEIYQNAEEALKAVKKGAETFDDLLVQQFTELGPHCSWCDEFYGSLRELTFGGEVPDEQKSYYAELLAVSGRVDNIEALVRAAEAAQGQEAGRIFGEALESTVGQDDVVSFLGSKLDSVPPNLKSSLVAAISNQGSELAIETLYKSAVQSGNPDGYYSMGTGLGELIPREESFPLLKGYVAKRDDYSHLPAKALLNAGVNGLKAVVETLETAPDPERDRAVLKDAIEHLGSDDETARFLREEAVKSSNPAVADFAKQALETIEREREEQASQLDMEEGEIGLDQFAAPGADGEETQ